MADIVFDYQKMETCVGTIRDIAKSYKSASETFQTAYTSAVKEWTGASKDKTHTFVTIAAKEFMEEQLPSLLTGLADLLAANIDNMGKTDTGMAEQIPENLSAE